MNYLKNHCWCRDSNWGGMYDCQIIVGLNSYEDNYKEDWNNLIIKEKPMTKLKHGVFPDLEIEVSYNVLKPEVLKWLEDNVPDWKGIKGWCVGSKDYSINDASCSYSIFFQRRRDAMKFIKTWSKWKKPLFYCQYFTDIRKELDIVTGKYKLIN